MDSQNFDIFLPLYDAVPPLWDEARPFIVEQLKRISTAVNIRTVGYKLTEEYLNGELLFPSNNSNPPQYRSVFRLMINCSPLVLGLNTFNLSSQLTIDSNFRLLNSYCGASNTSTFNYKTFADRDVSISGNILTVNSDGAYDQAFTTLEYIKEP